MLQADLPPSHLINTGIHSMKLAYQKITVNNLIYSESADGKMVAGIKLFGFLDLPETI